MTFKEFSHDRLVVFWSLVWFPFKSVHICFASGNELHMKWGKHKQLQLLGSKEKFVSKRNNGAAEILWEKCFSFFFQKVCLNVCSFQVSSAGHTPEIVTIYNWWVPSENPQTIPKLFLNKLRRKNGRRRKAVQEMKCVFVYDDDVTACTTRTAGSLSTSSLRVGYERSAISIWNLQEASKNESKGTIYFLYWLLPEEVTWWPNAQIACPLCREHELNQSQPCQVQSDKIGWQETLLGIRFSVGKSHNAGIGVAKKVCICSSGHIQSQTQSLCLSFSENDIFCRMSCKCPIFGIVLWAQYSGPVWKRPIITVPLVYFVKG